MAESVVQERFDERLESFDLRLFEKISSQTSDGDKRSLLAIQRGLRARADGYVYLEIGSYLGGSLQPHLLDERCRHIYSIDKRPLSQPDARGINYVYQHNSTARMLENLRGVDSAAVAKIATIDNDAKNIGKERIERRPQYCFVDGEHTDEAVFNDFLFCLQVVDPDGVIGFHDAPIVYKGLRRITKHLQQQGIEFRAYALPDTVFVVELNRMRLHETACVRDMLINNHVAYLASLHFNDGYREFATMPIFQLLRNLKAKVTRRNVFD